MKHDDWLLKKLKDPDCAEEYLNAAKDDDDPNTYLRALEQAAVLDEKLLFNEGCCDENFKDKD